MITGLAHGTDPAIVIAGMLLLGCLGCGLGILLPTLSLLTQVIVIRAHLGTATSVIILLRTSGGPWGPPSWTPWSPPG